MYPTMLHRFLCNSKERERVKLVGDNESTPNIKESKYLNRNLRRCHGHQTPTSNMRCSFETFNMKPKPEAWNMGLLDIDCWLEGMNCTEQVILWLAGGQELYWTGDPLFGMHELLNIWYKLRSIWKAGPLSRGAQMCYIAAWESKFSIDPKLKPEQKLFLANFSQSCNHGYQLSGEHENTQDRNDTLDRSQRPSESTFKISICKLDCGLQEESKFKISICKLDCGWQEEKPGNPGRTYVRMFNMTTDMHNYLKSVHNQLQHLLCHSKKHKLSSE